MTDAKLKKSESEVSDGQTKPSEVEFTNEAVVTFESTADTMDSEGSLVLYGSPAVYELPHQPARDSQH